MIVDNKKVTTEAENIELCSSACDVAMETCSSQSHDTYRSLYVFGKAISQYPYNKTIVNSLGYIGGFDDENEKNDD